MKCPFCGEPESKVIDSRPVEDGSVIRRRRECLKCTKRFTTYERIESHSILVIKKDGRREMFDREKIIRGLLKACEKRPVSREKIEEIADGIEAELRSEGRKEITSKEIGERVIEALKELDKVAYVRFASVYREFTDLTHFIKELENLLNKTIEIKEAKRNGKEP
ncbi:MAG: transcriptional regulator NrdR [Synergistetes bacterium]|nr:transcriptional regulator NrdR [Synergistota bacterium]MCX8128136.1 transcriptional regulator NrdR [Synergistota bacterium]MDW8192512.1 transcriptional regulator NrdR [Synergistota bacterium]